MNRRNLVLALLILSAAPITAFGQQGVKVWRVGVLTPRSRPATLDVDYYGAFPRAMRELGYLESKNLIIEWRFAEGKMERLPDLAAELVRLRVDAIVTGGVPATKAAQNATKTIPIVIGTAADPVKNGIVKSLGRPGGNVTGTANFAQDLSPKHLEMLLSLVPNLTHVAFLVNPANPSTLLILETARSAAKSVSVEVLPVKARDPKEIEEAFSTMSQKKVKGLIVAVDPLFIQQGRQIAELAAKRKLPTICSQREYTKEGGLVSYGQNLAEGYRRAATYVDKIFKGANPGDLPIEQPTRLDLVINRRAATALGLKLPQSLLILADEVIE
ncbi:MAG: ABC transporter substrate-binding protein [Betaproteobacteria bacterium]|nr:ABC transporter substrate-binding protein [Betaproteobacteria bacterium]